MQLVQNSFEEDIIIYNIIYLYYNNFKNAPIDRKLQIAPRNRRGN